MAQFWKSDAAARDAEAQRKAERRAARAEIAGIVENIDALTASITTMDAQIALIDTMVAGWDAMSNAQKFAATKDALGFIRRGYREAKDSAKIGKDILRVERTLIRGTAG